MNGRPAAVQAGPTTPRTAPSPETRVLVLAPTGNDAGLTAQFLERSGMEVRRCANMADLCGEIGRGCGVILIAEEALSDETGKDLSAALARQPSWSDVPVAIIAGGGEAAQRRLRRLSTAGLLGNVTLLERPFHPETLIRTVEAAVRARQRQYQVRDLLREQRGSEARMQRMLESISDAFAAFDREWRFTYVNSGYLRLVAPLYQGATDLIGHVLWERFPDIKGTDVERFYRRAMQDQQAGTMELFYEPLLAWLEVRAYPTPESLSIYVTDVTERRRAEKALRESESRYRILMERASEGIFVSDGRGQHLMINPAGCEMLGYELEEMLQLRINELYDPQNGGREVERIHRLQEGEVLRFEGKMRRRDAALVDVEASVTRLSNGLIQSVVRDVSARKRAEERQLKRNERAQLLSDTLAHLLGAGDPETIVRGLLPKVAAHLGVEVYLNFMVDEPSGTLRLHAHAGLDDETAVSLGQIEFGQALCGAAAQRRQAIIANRIHEKDDAASATVRALGMRCYACNPLVVGDHLLGTLSFGSRVREEFDGEEAEFLQMVAQYSAVALERIRTARELSGRTRTLEILNRIGSTLAGELEGGRLAQAVADAGREVTGAAFAAFFSNLRESETERLVLSAVSGAARQAVERLGQRWGKQVLASLTRGEGVVRIGDVAKDRRFGKLGARAQTGRGFPQLRSFLAAPVVSRSGEILGSLLFGHPEVNVFSEEVEQIVAGIAAQAAIAMDNARLYENVQKTADRLSLSISAANLGDFTWDAETDLIALSPRTAEIYGVGNVEGFTRSELRELLPPEDRERSKAALRQSIETRTDYDIEYRVNRAGGGTCWVAAKGRPFYGADGRILGMVGVVQDITELKHAEAVSDAKRRVLHLLAEGASLQIVLEELTHAVELETSGRAKGAIFLLDTDSSHLRVGAAPNLPQDLAQGIDGMSIVAGFLGVAVCTRQPVYVADIDADPLAAEVKEHALAHGLRSSWATPILSSEGEALGTFAIFYPRARELHHADMQVVETATRTAAVAIERRRNERALQESEARQRELLAGLPVACYTMDPEGRLTFFNDAAVRLWGRVPPLEDELWSGAFSATTDGKRLPMADSPASVALRERRSVRGVEAFIMRPDGSRRWVVPHPDPLFDPAGNCIGVINVIVDVTEERHAKRLLQEAKETAEAASAAKDRFLAVLSHELRTPLTPVLMTVASLELDSELPSDVREDMAMIRRNVELETKLIDDLLDLSRITSGKLRLRLQAVDLNEAVRQVCEICRSQVLEKGIRLECSLDPAVGTVSADSARLQQVLWNVIKNAAKFTPQDGEIRITTRAVDGMMEVQVRDNGIGIEPEMLSRVFDAFEQAAGITRQFGGLGLGLAISKALVELHGGTIKAESAGAGRGSVFTVRIPSVTAQADRPAAAAPPEQKWASGQLRVLVVEDHADTARTLGRLLRGAGFAVRTANDVATALQMGKTEAFDVLLSDIGLPDGTGYDVVRQLAAELPVKAIAMSGFGMDEDIRKSREAGFSEHLVKPVNVPELMQAIRRIGAPDAEQEASVHSGHDDPAPAPSS